MAAGVWGKKIGMTQIYAKDKVVPVTVIDTANWYITQIKREEKDGYNAVQIGCLRDKYVSEYTREKFTTEWIKKPQSYFVFLREVKIPTLSEEIVIGELFKGDEIVHPGERVDIVGNTIGKGFAGSVKRHRFRGGPSSHGDKMGRKTGSLSFMRSHGRVIKGKRLPGRMGNKQRVMKHLEIVKTDAGENILLVKGSIPGRPGSLVFIRKQKGGA